MDVKIHIRLITSGITKRWLLLFVLFLFLLSYLSPLLMSGQKSPARVCGQGVFVGVKIRLILLPLPL